MAALDLQYDDNTGYVLASATSLPAIADTATFERSTDQTHWSAVRGGTKVAVSGNAASIRDYEFSPNVPNYYRCRGVSSSAPVFVASSAAVSAVNASVVPTIPAGVQEGDLLAIWAAIRSSGAGSISTPAGWSVIWKIDNVALLGKRSAASESAPTVAVTGGGAGDDVIAQMASFRNLELVAEAAAYQLNPSAQNIAVAPAAGVQADWAAALQLGWKQDDWTSVAPLTGATEIGEPTSTTGNDAGIVWNYRLMTTAAAVTADAFVVTGGGGAISYGATVILRKADYVVEASSVITPAMTRVWLKFPTAPYLNKSVVFAGWSENRRTSRVGLYSPLASRDAGAYFDIASPRTITITVWAQTDEEQRILDLILSYSGVVFLHLPATVVLDSMYGGIGDYRWVKTAARSHKAEFTIPLTEVSQPPLTITGNKVTWATLLTRYGSWTEVVAAHATWTSVLAMEGTPDDLLITY